MLVMYFISVTNNNYSTRYLSRSLADTGRMLLLLLAGLVSPLLATTPIGSCLLTLLTPMGHGPM